MSVSGDKGTTIRKATEEFIKLKAAYDAKDNTEALARLKEIKKNLIHFPTFLNPHAQSTTRGQELLLTREVLEYAVLLSARCNKMDEFELYFNQLNVYYTDAADEPALPESPMLYLILGLNLVRLLVTSRIAQFHTELEKIPHASHSNANIRFAVLIERYLMEGSYNKVLRARAQAPSNEFVPIVELLQSTVRSEVANCIPTSYDSLSIEAAQKVMMLSTREEALAMGEAQNWTLSADGSCFTFVREEDLAKREIPFKEMLKHHILFAADLQRIV